MARQTISKGSPVAEGASDPVGITWLMNDFVDRVAGVDHAVVLSRDGILIAGSRRLEREEAEHLSAAAAGIHSLARAAGQRFGGGGMRQTVIEMETGVIFVTAGGSGACVAVMAAEHADAGVVAYELQMLVARVGQHLSTPNRTTPQA
jgi:predicted regulator of Ras-like GTPase activity (Roadblock/LC7/MglB family)